MRTHRRRIPVAAALLLVTGGLVWLFVILFGPREPVYAGHRISYWIDLTPARANVSPALMRVAMSGTTSIGSVAFFPIPASSFPAVDSNAVPYLVKALYRRNGLPHKWYAALWVKLPVQWQKRLLPPLDAEIVHANAARMLVSICPLSPETIVALASAVTNDNGIGGATAIDALIRFGGDGPTAMQAWLQILQNSTNQNKRVGAIQGLRPAIGKDPAVTAVFVRLVSDPDSGVRQQAARTVQTSADLLANTALHEPNPTMQLEALKKLRSLGPALTTTDWPMFDDLIRIATNDNHATDVRVSAIETLTQVGSESAQVMVVFKDLKGNANSAISHAAAVATDQFLPRLLLEFASDTNGWSEETPVMLLVGAAAVQDRELLLKLLALAQNGPDPETRRNAVKALGYFADQNPAAIQVLVHISLNEAQAAVRLPAIDALSRIGARNESAIEGMAQVAETETYSSMRVFALERLVEMGGRNPRVMDGLIKLKNDPDPGVRAAVARLRKKIEDLPDVQ